MHKIGAKRGAKLGTNPSAQFGAKHDSKQGEKPDAIYARISAIFRKRTQKCLK